MGRALPIRVASWLALTTVLICVMGCQPAIRRTCPTERLSCECFELESREPLEEVTRLLDLVTDMSDPALQGPIAAASDLEARCGGGDGEGLPPEPSRDATWRRRCSEAELALPHLLRTLEALESRRAVTGAYRAQENTFAVGLVSALGTITLGNPDTVCRASVTDALLATLEMPESRQDLRVNARALELLGELGDARAAPALVRALFVRGGRRRLDLEAAARLALQQLHDPAAVAEALVRAGRGDEEALGPAGAALDPREVKGIVASVLGSLGVTEPVVIDYLLAELRHGELDAVDRAPSTGRHRYTPETARAHRRAVAARALGRLGHEDALDVILPRLELREDGSSVDPTVHISAIPAYLDAIGDLLRPDRTELPLLSWLARGDPTLRDIVARRLTLQGTDALIPRLREVAATLPECRASGGCIRRNFEQRYLPALQRTATCEEVSCWAGHLGADSDQTRRERAAAQLILLVRRDPSAREGARHALADALEAGAGEATELIALGIERVSRDGADPETIATLERALASMRRRAPEGHEARTTAALLARLRARGSR